MFDEALGAPGMLGTMTMALTIDAYGPNYDGAGCPNNSADGGAWTPLVTSAAIGKCFAIGSDKHLVRRRSLEWPVRSAAPCRKRAWHQYVPYLAPPSLTAQAASPRLAGCPKRPA